MKTAGQSPYQGQTGQGIVGGKQDFRILHRPVDGQRNPHHGKRSGRDFGHGFLNHFHKKRNNIFPGDNLPAGVNPAFPSPQIAGEQGNTGGLKIRRKNVTVFPAEIQQDGLATHGSVAASHFLHILFRDQILDDGGDGGFGEPQLFCRFGPEMGPRLMMVSSTRLRFMLRINSLLPVTMLLLSGGRVPACCILVSSIQQFVWKVNE